MSALAAAATAVHEVPGGGVADLAAALLDQVGDGALVALGGGRVIDTAKALAAVGGNTVAAIPTTMSGAEMTAIHRLPAGGRGTRQRPRPPGARPRRPGADDERPGGRSCGPAR